MFFFNVEWFYNLCLFCSWYFVLFFSPIDLCPCLASQFFFVAQISLFIKGSISFHYWVRVSILTRSPCVRCVWKFKEACVILYSLTHIPACYAKLNSGFSTPPPLIPHQSQACSSLISVNVGSFSWNTLSHPWGLAFSCPPYLIHP